MNYKLNIKLISVMFCITSLFIIISCNQEKTKNKDTNGPFSEIDFTNDNLKVYFFNIPYHDSIMFPKSDFEIKYGNFYITNKITLQKIKDEIVKDKIYLKDFSSNFYLVMSNQNNELITLGVLETESDFFSYYGDKYYFNLEHFEKLNDYFIPLSSYNVYCKTLSHSNDFYDYMQTIDGFLYTHNQKKPYANYNGFVELYVEIDDNGIAFIEDKLDKDFESVGEYSLTQATYYTEDSAIVKMFWKDDYTNKLPPEYTILKPYSDSISFAFTVFDTDKNRIIEFFEKEGIDDYEIEDNI